MISLPHQFKIGTKVSLKISYNCVRFGEVIALDKRLSETETCHTVRYFKIQVKWSHTVLNGNSIPREITSWIRCYSVDIVG